MAISFGLFILQLLRYYNIRIFQHNGFVTYLFICALLYLIILAKIVICTIIGFLFQVQKEFSEYLFNIFIYNKNLGLFMIPFIFIIPYVHQYIIGKIIILGLIVLFSMYFVRITRSIQIIIKKDVLLFYTILYLCTLEILPVLIGIKLVKSLI